MKSCYVTLNTVEKIKRFVDIVSSFSGDFDLISERYVVDAKSVMGIFSLDLGKPLKLDIRNDNEVDAALEQLKEFI